MFLGLPDSHPDPFFASTDPDPDPSILGYNDFNNLIGLNRKWNSRSKKMFSVFFIAFRARLASKLENVLFYYFDLGKKFLSQNHGYQKSKIR